MNSNMSRKMSRKQKRQLAGWNTWLAMQAAGLWQREKLVWKLAWRMDLRRIAKDSKVSLRTVVKNFRGEQ